MAMSGSTWRVHPFKLGMIYRALEESPEFTNGRIIKSRDYRLVHIGYSHYDGASVFNFECVTTNEKVAWWWFDSAEEELCEKYFKLIT